MLLPNSYFVKICGITNIKDAEAACMFGASAIGFIGYPKSKRYISSYNVKSIASEIHNRFPKVRQVGVFVDEDILKIIDYINAGIDVVQLHGNETLDYVDKLKAVCKDIEVWRAIRLKDKSDIINLERYRVEKYLIDSFVKGEAGGTGVVCDWRLARFAVQTLPRPVILAGGLSASNFLEAMESVKPFGVDVSSGVELSPGVKDHSLMKAFLQKAKGKV